MFCAVELEKQEEHAATCIDLQQLQAAIAGLLQGLASVMLP